MPIKVIHIEFLKPPPGRGVHYYFGSKAAIYHTFTAEELGISYASLRNLGDIKTQPYANRKCVIRQGELLVAKHRKEEE
jgi:hypothetical protein